MLLIRYHLLIIYLTTQQISGDVIDNVIDALHRNLMYISKNYKKINIDCLYGVVLSRNVLENAQNCPGPYRATVRNFITKIDEIYGKTVPIFQQQAYWNNFARYIVDRELVRKSIKYHHGNFQNRPTISGNLNITETLSDYCLSTLINQTIDLETKRCRFPEICGIFLGNFRSGTGYAKTHQLLFLQIAHQRHCLMDLDNFDRILHEICATIYTETVNLDKFESFDLFLEQSILCGVEGFDDFLKSDWLDLILSIQKSAGCFPDRRQSRDRRTTNQWRDGCADHTTGLGASVLSLYLDYLISNKYRC